MLDRAMIAGVLSAAIVAASHGAELGYYSQPALHGERLVFVSEGDLWVARLPETLEKPIVAYRLTSSDGSESHPCFSPDGTQLAFAAQYDGNTDVYVMPADGGAPTRLTYHPDSDIPLAWTPDGATVLFKSSRAHHFGRTELWRISARGGMPVRYPFGECSMVSMSETGSRIAFTRWSNENWTWKRYRGGTAPEIWVGDLNAERFTRLTEDASNDMFPMWKRGRVFFVSDRSGITNIYSDSPQGGDLKQHTDFASDAARPAALDGYDIRWPSADAARRGRRIVFSQAGALVLLDVVDNVLARLDVRIASDRVATRQRFAKPLGTMTGYALSPDGSSLVVETRGELLIVPVKGGEPVQLTRSSASREWGASYLDDERLVLISDRLGEQQIQLQLVDGSEFPAPVTENRADWLFPPRASPDGRWVAFADKTMRLHVLDLGSLNMQLVDRSEAGEITDYRFSPDSNWIAYTKPMPNGMGAVHIHALNTRRSFPVSDGLSDDRELRWDPSGLYVYFIGERHLDPVMGDLDFEHVFLESRKVFVVPLTTPTPPPLPDVARAAGFDLKEWATKKASTEDAEDDEAWQIQIETDGLTERHYALGITPGNLQGLQAQRGALTYVVAPIEGLLADDFLAASDPTVGDLTLHRFDLIKEKDSVLATGISGYAISRDGDTIAYPAPGGFKVMPSSGGDVTEVDISAVQLRLDMRQEWKQIFEESWRLQRDFYWAPNMVGVNWDAMGEKYRALLGRVGTRAELNDLIGQMIGELGTSHSYIFGGQNHDHATPVSVGMLGADVEFDGRGFRIARVLPGHLWDDAIAGPLAPPHLGVTAGSYIVAINGTTLSPASNIYELLQGEAGKIVRLEIADDALGAGQRTVRVKAIGGERAVRYASWVEANRVSVDRASEGQLGYLHIPDMGGKGLVAFSRLFYAQVNKKGIVIDVRNNGGGFVSQMIVHRLAKKPIAYDAPRHGRISRYPENSLNAHLVTLIDQHAGSDGDIFPAAFRALGLGPLIGMRTWGGVVGIRADKPFVDMGLSTQPEFAWWEEAGGWTIENFGVKPDIEIDITPNDRIAGRDAQLDRAIEYLLEQLASDPKEAPSVPTYPVRAVKPQ